MKETPMRLDTLLHETGVIADPPPDALAAARTRLDAEMTSASARSSRGRSRAVAVVAVAAAAATIALLVAPTLDVGRGEPAATAQAAQVLRRAGAAAGAQPGGWPDAPYWHSVSEYRQGAEPPVRREIWIGHRAKGVLKDPGVDTGVIPLGVGIFPTGASGVDWEGLYALPTEPAPLERRLRASINGAGNGDDSELFVIVGDLLRESPAPPALRKALWEVAAGIPGVRLVGPVTDSAGRPGVAVERDFQRYVLDPDDGRLLEESAGTGTPAPEAPNGTAWRSTYLDQGPATTAPAPTPHTVKYE
jgi:hypothetical protein